MSARRLGRVVIPDIPVPLVVLLCFFLVIDARQ